MIWLLRILLFRALSLSGEDDQLRMELLVLRQQLALLLQKQPRSKVDRWHRLLWVWLSQGWPHWKSACVLVKPATVIGWHRQGWRIFWRWKSRKKKPGHPPVNTKVIALIRRMAEENPSWGGARIHGEMARLGIRVSESSVHRYLPKRPPTPNQVQNWRTFLSNHREVIAAMDFLVVPTWRFQQLYMLMILDHGRRLVRHLGVTAHPSEDWVKQQLREAFPFGEIPKYLIHDRDAIFRGLQEFIASFGIERKRIGFRCPWQNGVLERFNGTVRRELLDHVLVLDEDHLRRLLKEFVRHYHEDRTHLGLGKDTPKGRPVEKPPDAFGEVVAVRRLGGLTHRYAWKQAA